MLLDAAQHPLGVEPAVQHQRRAEQHRQREVAEAPGVEGGGGEHGRAAGAQRDAVEHRDGVARRRRCCGRRRAGVPVVPLVRMTCRAGAGRAQRGRRGPSTAASRASSSVVTSSTPGGAPRTPRRAASAVAPWASSTARVCSGAPAGVQVEHVGAALGRARRRSRPGRGRCGPAARRRCPRRRRGRAGRPASRSVRTSTSRQVSAAVVVDQRERGRGGGPRPAA